jgi:hypothetical protein
MIDLSGNKFGAMSKSVEQKKIIAAGPMYFYYENRSSKEMVGLPPYGDNFGIDFGFHTGFEYGLEPKWDEKFNESHASPIISLEKVLKPGENFEVSYCKGGALMSPEFDSTHDFWYTFSPDNYFLYSADEKNEFEGYVIGRLTELGLINDEITELHADYNKNRKISIKEGLNYIHNLFDSYLENKCFNNKELGIRE